MKYDHCFASISLPQPHRTVGPLCFPHKIKQRLLLYTSHQVFPLFLHTFNHVLPSTCRNWTLRNVLYFASASFPLSCSPFKARVYSPEHACSALANKQKVSFKCIVQKQANKHKECGKV
ncbi:hypothetical protein, unlikely [Trypanosoma brucei gambiense DAL972]|uniref:Uncharacterized protein n=1 Tax=Trypanosoma brucei gambiense (strain MHOM/CI/86/DAL972) TaxID=679716 RepID=D0A291_TRYB9|nr:hypothetical protein, unlikely [Trypanosoma brucei gambiense DAL972]CBH15385.1 hypothetical protein, unlikely [Trypanosoma brucei gambiense DAL972]|eukprot:XP_011777649.1 hypothetical protein, unlikely [Trypanosoma brucei gambiense DAL972]